MPYRYPRFGDIPLPLLNPRYQHDPAPTDSPFMRSVGGYYAPRGETDGAPLAQSIAVTATYLGQMEYLVDETGARIVDETGDYLIAGDACLMLRTQVVALSEVVRTWNDLWRENIDDGVLTWKRAQFTSLRAPANVDNLFAVEVTASFATIMANWHAETLTTASASTTSGVAKTLTVDNPGDTVEDAIVTVTRTSGTITGFSLACAELGIGWVWTGSLGVGDVLTIDTSKPTVLKNEVAAYSGFAFSGHTKKGYLPIPRGTYFFVVTTTGGNATVAIDFYTQFK